MQRRARRRSQAAEEDDEEVPFCWHAHDRIYVVGFVEGNLQSGYSVFFERMHKSRPSSRNRWPACGVGSEGVGVSLVESETLATRFWIRAMWIYVCVYPHI